MRDVVQGFNFGFGFYLSAATRYSMAPLPGHIQIFVHGVQGGINTITIHKVPYKMRRVLE